MVADPQPGLPDLPPPRPELGSRVEDLRFHRGDWSETAPDLIAEQEGATVPRSTSVMRRYQGKAGTVRTELLSLLRTHRGNRVRHRQSMDFDDCTVSDEIALFRPGGGKEILTMRASLGRCEGTLEAMWSRLGAAVERGPEAVREVGSTGPLTVETSTLRIVVPREEWERDGNRDIADSLSPAFLRVLEEEVLPLALHDPGLTLICELVGGLLGEDCPGLAGPPGVNTMGLPDCEFDAEFDMPCTSEQQRAFDVRRGASDLARP